jgi:hypothetical protein
LPPVRTSYVAPPMIVLGVYGSAFGEPVTSIVSVACEIAPKASSTA